MAVSRRGGLEGRGGVEVELDGRAFGKRRGPVAGHARDEVAGRRVQGGSQVDGDVFVGTGGRSDGADERGYRAVVVDEMPDARRPAAATARQCDPGPP